MGGSIGRLAIFEKNKSIYLLLFLYVISATLTIIFFNGTGDSGDSIYHYQYARFAPLHPELFFNQWAKPVYVLLASPFAQFGFIGIKIFNAIVSLLNIFLTYQICQKMEIKNPLVGAIILFFMPLYYILTFSGFTEPLFALFLSVIIYSILNKKFITASIVISFLPFVRSEGLIILILFAIYFIIKGKWKLLSLFIIGHLFYSISGYFVYHDFLWVFNKIPYNKMSSTYGSGKLTNFVEQLFYIVGIPIYILFWFGFLHIFWRTIKTRVTTELLFLVFLGFLSIFLAHTFFWYFGMFNSMGLKRVLLTVAPLISIISLFGFNFLTEEIFKSKKFIQSISKAILIIIIVVFPFTSNKSAIIWKDDMCLSFDQIAAIKTANFILKNAQDKSCFVYVHPYLSEALHIDPFDSNKHLEFVNKFLNHLKTGDIIIWENWFSVVEYGINKELLDTNSELINIYNSKDQGNKGEIQFSVYKHI